MEGRRLGSYYSTGDALRAKHATATGVSGVPFPEWVIDRLDLIATHRAVDAGCGWGRFATVLADRLPDGAELVCSDMFPGMIASARDALVDAPVRTVFLAADIEQMPLRDGTADLAMANHVLYHLRDFAAGVRELARLMAPGGTFVATTNADAIRIPVVEAHEETLVRLGIRLETGDHRGFSLENGYAALEPWFASVEEHMFRDEQVSDVERLTAGYVNTGRYRTVVEDKSIPAELRQRLVDIYRDVAAEMAEPDGTIHEEITMVAYICRGPAP